jgi:LuxR family transcriptional regulator, maltose regulon positive regulatory protein
LAAQEGGIFQDMCVANHSSIGEIRVLRYLPTNLSQPEIANELHVSRNTIRTHLSHLYAKLDTHCRTEAVERARALGFLAPLERRR